MNKHATRASTIVRELSKALRHPPDWKRARDYARALEETCEQGLAAEDEARKATHSTRDMHGCRWCGVGEQTPCDCQDRIDCPDAGDPLHHGCGWCSTHGRPRFACLWECWGLPNGR